MKKGGVGSNSTISQLIEAQESATIEIKRLQAENTVLRSKLTQKSTKPSSSGSMAEENYRLKTENGRLRKQVEDLKEQMITVQQTANDRADKLLKAFAP